MIRIFPQIIVYVRVNLVPEVDTPLLTTIALTVPFNLEDRDTNFNRYRVTTHMREHSLDVFSKLPVTCNTLPNFANWDTAIQLLLMGVQTQLLNIPLIYPENKKNYRMGLLSLIKNPLQLAGENPIIDSLQLDYAYRLVSDPSEHRYEETITINKDLFDPGKGGKCAGMIGKDFGSYRFYEVVSCVIQLLESMIPKDEPVAFLPPIEG